MPPLRCTFISSTGANHDAASELCRSMTGSMHNFAIYVSCSSVAIPCTRICVPKKTDFEASPGRRTLDKSFLIEASGKLLGHVI